ncbi:hypothetical protein [Micromonospora sp. NBRC 101691]|uniref:hypothetical protein n=1 Tax=Micromonospora sp. NBRC 101691 TaxID=3032198 RepID=UPI00255719F8|nr:hypothetical protein [Micromonospora sp. NBRC 101691]
MVAVTGGVEVQRGLDQGEVGERLRMVAQCAAVGAALLMKQYIEQQNRPGQGTARA